MSGKESDDTEQEFEVPDFHRNEDLDEDGVSQVVIERFVHYRLPFLLAVKKEMDEGRTLTDGELELMTRLIDRAQNIYKFVYQHPEYKTLVAQIIDLVHDITGEALANAEKK